jgi:hypothetical protein
MLFKSFGLRFGLISQGWWEFQVGLIFDCRKSLIFLD